MIHHWKGDEGVLGELEFANYLESDLKFDKVRNVTDVKLWQRRGVDIIAHKGHKEIWFDVKTDKCIGNTHNVVCELFEKDVEGKLGWFLTSLAHWIAIYLPQKQEFLLIELSNFEKAISKYWDKLTPYKAKHTKYATLGMLLPLELLENYVSRPHQLLIPQVVAMLCNVRHRHENSLLTQRRVHISQRRAEQAKEISEGKPTETGMICRPKGE